MRKKKIIIYEFYPDTMPTEITVTKSMYYYYCTKYCNSGYNWVKRITEDSEKVVNRLTVWKK